MKSLQQHIEERLIINKNYKYDNDLLDIIKNLWCSEKSIDVKCSKDNITFNFLWCTSPDGSHVKGLTVFTDEIYDAMQEYEHNKYCAYYQYGTDIHKKNETLKTLINKINELGIAEVLFESNTRASKNNFQLIKINEGDILIYIIGKAIYKNGKFKDIKEIYTFKILMIYND